MQRLNSITQSVNAIYDYLSANSPTMVSAGVSQITHIFQTIQTFSDQWIYAPIHFVIKKMHEHVWVYLDRPFSTYLNSLDNELALYPYALMLCTKAVPIAIIMLKEIILPCRIFFRTSCLLPFLQFCRELYVTAPRTAFFMATLSMSIEDLALRIILFCTIPASMGIAMSVNIHEFVMLARIYTITKIASAAFATHPLTALIFHVIAISACSRNADNSSFPLEDFFSRCFGVDQFIQRLSTEQLARLNMITSIAIATVIITLTLLGAPVIFSTTCGYVTVLAAKAMIVYRHVRAKTFETLRTWEEDPTAGSRENRRVVANRIRNEISSYSNHPLLYKLKEQLLFQHQDNPDEGRLRFWLCLDHTSVSSLPDVFDDPYLMGITLLDISSNDITALPSSIQCLTRLRRLDVRNICTLDQIANEAFESLPHSCTLVLKKSNLSKDQEEHFNKLMNQSDYQGPQFSFVNEDTWSRNLMAGDISSEEMITMSSRDASETPPSAFADID